MKSTKWLKDTEIARKIYKGKILDSRLDQEAEEFEIKVEYDDGIKPAGGVFKAPTSGWYSTSSTIYIDDAADWSGVRLADHINSQYVDEECYVRYGIESEKPEDRSKRSGSRCLELPEE